MPKSHCSARRLRKEASRPLAPTMKSPPARGPAFEKREACPCPPFPNTRSPFRLRGGALEDGGRAANNDAAGLAVARADHQGVGGNRQAPQCSARPCPPANRGKPGHAPDRIRPATSVPPGYPRWRMVAVLDAMAPPPRTVTAPGAKRPTVRSACVHAPPLLMTTSEPALLATTPVNHGVAAVHAPGVGNGSVPSIHRRRPGNRHVGPRALPDTVRRGSPIHIADDRGVGRNLTPLRNSTAPLPTPGAGGSRPPPYPRPDGPTARDVCRRSPRCRPAGTGRWRRGFQNSPRTHPAG